LGTIFRHGAWTIGPQVFQRLKVGPHEIEFEQQSLKVFWAHEDMWGVRQTACVLTLFCAWVQHFRRVPEVIIRGENFFRGLLKISQGRLITPGQIWQMSAAHGEGFAFTEEQAIRPRDTYFLEAAQRVFLGACELWGALSLYKKGPF